MSNAVEILDAAGYRRTLTRIAHEIIERNEALENLCLVGILRRGAPIAEQLRALIESISGVRLPVGYLDITLYRDDLKEKTDMPEVHGTNIPFSVQGKRVAHPRRLCGQKHSHILRGNRAGPGEGIGRRRPHRSSEKTGLSFRPTGMVRSGQPLKIDNNNIRRKTYETCL